MITRGSTDIEWPADLLPANTPVFAHNELRIDARPEVVWAWLVRAQRWSEYYFNCRGLKFVGGRPEHGELRPDVRFTWWTFGVPVDCTVTEFQANRRLAWRGGGAGASGYHGWLIQPAGDASLVVTEEVQAGLVPRLAAPILNRALAWTHQKWLESLARVATAGPPDS